MDKLILRGFSQNKILLQQNIKDDSISSKRIVKDHMLANKLQSYSVESTNEMRKSVRAARARYAVYLEEEKKKNESLKTKRAKKIIYRNIKEVYSKITEKSETSKILDEKFVLLVEEAEKKKDINLVVQANALKRKTRKQKRKEESLKRLKLYDQKNNMITQKEKL